MIFSSAVRANSRACLMAFSLIDKSSSRRPVRGGKGRLSTPNDCARPVREHRSPAHRLSSVSSWNRSAVLDKAIQALQNLVKCRWIVFYSGIRTTLSPDLIQQVDGILGDVIADMYDEPHFILLHVLDELAEDHEIKPGERILIAEYVKSWFENQN